MSLEVGRRYALCVGIGHYTALASACLKYAVSDAESVADILGDLRRGNFAVTRLIEPEQTMKHELERRLDVMLNAPDLKPEDMVVIYFACHGMVYGTSEIFCLLPSDARLEKDGTPNKTTVIDIYDLTKTLAGAKVKNSNYSGTPQEAYIRIWPGFVHDSSAIHLARERRGYLHRSPAMNVDRNGGGASMSSTRSLT